VGGVGGQTINSLEKSKYYFGMNQATF